MPGKLPDDVDPVLILVVASGVTGLLVYTTPIKGIMGCCLVKTFKKPSNNPRHLILYGIYIFRMYRLPYQDIAPPDDMLLTAGEMTVSNNDLVEKGWRIRGGAWFLLTLFLACPFVRAVSGADVEVCKAYLAILIVATLAVSIAISREWRTMKDVTLLLAQFYWLDNLVTSKRRTEVTSEPSQHQVSFRQPLPLDTTRKKPEKGKKAKYIPVAVIRDVTVRRTSERRYSELVDGECEVLRDYITRKSWDIFAMRFEKLRDALIAKGRGELRSLLDRLHLEWALSWQTTEHHVPFQNLRELSHLLLEECQVPDNSCSTVKLILRHDQDWMSDPSWSKGFIKEVYSKDNFRRLDLAKTNLRRYAVEIRVRQTNVTVSPRRDDESIWEYLDRLDDYAKRNGGHIFQPVPKEQIEEAPLATYWGTTYGPEENHASEDSQT